MFLIESSLIFFITLFFIIKISNFFKINPKVTISIFLFRTFLCLSYLPIAISLEWDAPGYFLYTGVDSFGIIGTDLIFTITYFIKYFLNLNIYSSSLIYAFIGNIGILTFLAIIKDRFNNINLDKKIKFLAFSVIFFPTLNLWTSCIGKDAITFTCINLIIYSLLKLRTRILVFIISITLFTLVRPHIGLILIFALIISFTSKVDLPIYYSLLIRISAIFGIIYMSFSAKKIIPGIGNLNNISQFADKISFYQEITADGNNAINLQSMSFPLKIFTFMFRPLLFDANELFSFVMSFENIILLLIFVYPFLRVIKTLKFIKITIDSKLLFLSIYILSTWSIFSLTVANLGTANRYKLMILPALVYLLLCFSGKEKSDIYKKFSN